MTSEKPTPFLPQHLDEIQGWFFDLDGTLMDTDDQAVEDLAHRLRLIGNTRSRQLARRLILLSETPMNHAITMLDMVGLDPWIFALRRRLRHRVEPTFRLIPGVRPVIRHLAAVGQLAVVSTRSQADADLFLKQHALSDHFRLLATQETTKRLKPHPEPILYAARQLGLDPAACVMIGDTTVDMRAARRAGAWAVGVLCGFGEETELWRAGAHMILESTADLLPLVTR